MRLEVVRKFPSSKKQYKIESTRLKVFREFLNSTQAGTECRNYFVSNFIVALYMYRYFIIPRQHKIFEEYSIQMISIYFKSIQKKYYINIILKIF